MLYM